MSGYDKLIKTTERKLKRQEKQVTETKELIAELQALKASKAPQGQVTTHGLSLSTE